MGYYKKKDFTKAGILFDEIMPLMKGDSTQELATFYQANCDFNLGSYTLASSHFKKFAEVFSRSEFAEEAIYMSAYSLYKDSPNFNLDQTGTLAAINEIQSYLNNYPEKGFEFENALSREETLKGMTIWAAYSNFEENEKGSIEVGKLADFTMLNQDIMTIDGANIPTTKATATYINGEKVY